MVDSVSAALVAPRLGKVLERTADGAEVRKHIPFSYKGGRPPIYYVWLAGATVGIASNTLAGAREMAGIKSGMGEKAMRRMGERHAAEEKRKLERVAIAASHKGRPGLKTNNKGLSR